MSAGLLGTDFSFKASANIYIGGYLKIGDDVQLNRTGSYFATLSSSLAVGSELDVNSPSGSPVLNLQMNGVTKGYFGSDGSHSYLTSNVGSIIATTPNGYFDAQNGLVGGDSGSGGVAVGCAPYGSANYPYETIQLPSNHNLRINFGGAERLVIDNVGSIYPTTSNYQFCGKSTNYWNAVYTQYTCYHYTYTNWDAVDDLGLARNLMSIKETRQTPEGESYEVDVISRESLRFLEDQDGFYRSNDVTGYLLCCIKALVLRLEVLENQVSETN
jgi:hypothetical protein